jgi:hypothetical protein
MKTHVHVSVNTDKFMVSVNKAKFILSSHTAKFMVSVNSVPIMGVFTLNMLMQEIVDVFLTHNYGFNYDGHVSLTNVSIRICGCFIFTLDYLLIMKYCVFTSGPWLHN